MNAGTDLVLKASNLVLHLQLPTLQLGNFHVIRGGMRKRIPDFFLKGLMLGLEYLKMNIWGHAGLLGRIGA